MHNNQLISIVLLILILTGCSDRPVSSPIEPDQIDVIISLRLNNSFPISEFSLNEEHFFSLEYALVADSFFYDSFCDFFVTGENPEENRQLVIVIPSLSFGYNVSELGVNSGHHLSIVIPTPPNQPPHLEHEMYFAVLDCGEDIEPAPVHLTVTVDYGQRYFEIDPAVNFISADNALDLSIELPTQQSDIRIAIDSSFPFETTFVLLIVETLPDSSSKIHLIPTGQYVSVHFSTWTNPETIYKAGTLKF